ncbi:MAG TPA: NAD(P)/FAD-dependent oxidoreductase [Polyangiaceae bacterium]|nr:NAD(P)/FAD-dependent oxidoreductase [Polyangiaceae bacterium]
MQKGSNGGASRDHWDAEVAIIGAGPAGTAAAAHLGQLGVKDVVLVDRHDFPRDKTCGSGISPKGIQTLRELGVWDAVEPHSYRIGGIRIVTPSGHESWQSAGDRAEAVVCHRRVLDNILLERAKSFGVEFVPYFTATNMLKDGERVVGFSDRKGRTVRARHVIVAGGSHCRIGVDTTRPRRIIQAIMGWWDDVPFRPHHVEMIFDKMVAPYYGWLFPEGNNRVNIGITYEDPVDAGAGRDPKNKKNARQLFQQFLDKHYAQRLKHGKQVGAWKGHPVVYSYSIDRLTGPGRVVIGEAGLMTHPATAEGIYQGMRSGMLGAEAVADVLAGRQAEADALAEYEARCRRAFHLSFLGGALFRAALKTPVIDWLVKAGEQPMVGFATAKLMAHM